MRPNESSLEHLRRCSKVGYMNEIGGVARNLDWVGAPSIKITKFSTTVIF